MSIFNHRNALWCGEDGDISLLSVMVDINAMFVAGVLFDFPQIQDFIPFLFQLLQ